MAMLNNQMVIINHSWLCFILGISWVYPSLGWCPPKKQGWFMGCCILRVVERGPISQRMDAMDVITNKLFHITIYYPYQNTDLHPAIFEHKGPFWGLPVAPAIQWINMLLWKFHLLQHDFMRNTFVRYLTNKSGSCCKVNHVGKTMSCLPVPKSPFL